MLLTVSCVSDLVDPKFSRHSKQEMIPILIDLCVDEESDMTQDKIKMETNEYH